MAIIANLSDVTKLDCETRRKHKENWEMKVAIKIKKDEFQMWHRNVMLMKRN